MDKKDVYVIRPGVVEYIDLCKHEGVGRSEFFNTSGLKTLRYYGLILELDDLVKVFSNDDVTDDTEGEGIVIPRSCVNSVIYFKEDYSELVPTLDSGSDVN